MWPAEVQLEGLVDKKPAGSEPTPLLRGGGIPIACAQRCGGHDPDGPARAIRLVVIPPRALHSATVAYGVVHHRRAAAVGASDDDAEELLTLVKF